MERLQLVLFQLDEAKRHLSAGSMPALRVALLLLDNTVELLLDRWIAHDLGHEALLQLMQRRIREAGIPESHATFVDLFQQRFLTGAEKKKLARFFDEKLRYVTDTKKRLTPPISAVLSHLHRYRNDAHHIGCVRPQTLRTSVLILLALCSTLVELLEPGGYTYAPSTDDYSWLKERFNIEPIALFDKGTLTFLLASLRDGISLDEASICETLAQNLESRIEALDDGLDFIFNETRVAPNKTEALALSQRYTLDELMRAPPYRRGPPDLDKPVSLAQIDHLRLTPQQVRNAENSLAGFQIFSTADTDLERIEFMVDGLVVDIKLGIQMAVDLERGK